MEEGIVGRMAGQGRAEHGMHACNKTLEAPALLFPCLVPRGFSPWGDSRVHPVEVVELPSRNAVDQPLLQPPLLGVRVRIRD